MSKVMAVFLLLVVALLLFGKVAELVDSLHLPPLSPEMFIVTVIMTMACLIVIVLFLILLSLANRR